MTFALTIFAVWFAFNLALAVALYCKSPRSQRPREDHPLTDGRLTGARWP